MITKIWLKLKDGSTRIVIPSVDNTEWLHKLQEYFNCTGVNEMKTLVGGHYRKNGASFPIWEGDIVDVTIGTTTTTCTLIYDDEMGTLCLDKFKSSSLNHIMDENSSVVVENGFIEDLTPTAGCIVCKQPITVDRSANRNTQCVNGHVYHYGNDGEIHVGPSNPVGNICCEHQTPIKILFNHVDSVKFPLKSNGKDSCPVCQDKIYKTCKCMKSDSTCVNGHEWYFNEEGKVILGSTSHGFPPTNIGQRYRYGSRTVQISGDI